MAVLAPRILLNRVDLPTFGRPIMATNGKAENRELDAGSEPMDAA
jgi:hypothetical protein